MDACVTYLHDPTVPVPLELAYRRATDGETIAVNLERNVDCDGQGVTVSSAVWAIHPDDIDIGGALENQLLAGYVASVRITDGTPGTVPRYSLRITTSAGDTRTLWYAVPVAEGQP